MPWPGNVRELQNVIERTLIISQGRELVFDQRPIRRPRDANGAERAKSNGVSSARPYTELEWKELEKQNLLLGLSQSNWKVQGAGDAAERLEIKPTTLHARMRVLELSKPIGSA